MAQHDMVGSGEWGGFWFYCTVQCMYFRVSSYNSIEWNSFYSVGLYKTVVTYFFLNRFVAHIIITLSLMDRAYMWFNMTWLGRGNRVGSQANGVSLLRMTWSKCGGKIGGNPMESSPSSISLRKSSKEPAAAAAALWAKKSGISCPNLLSSSSSKS